MKNAWLGCLICSMLFVASACAEDLPFRLKLNDDIAAVKEKLKTNLDPEPVPRNPILPATAFDVNKGRTFLHLRTKGIWAFFDKEGKADAFRFDAPFDGSLRGVKISDSEKILLATMGKPISKPSPAFGTMTAYKYVWDDSAYLTFDLNDDGVQYIFIGK
jgi:hypothetical protein